MKTFYFTFFLFFFLSIFSQAPRQISYQAVARNSSGQVLPNQLIGIKFQLHQSSAAGTVVFTEQHTQITNTFGLFTLGIGSVNTALFATINWANGPYFLEVLIDPAGGTSYTSVGTQQLVSVPYALYAETAGNANVPTPTITINTPNTVSSGSSATYSINVPAPTLGVSGNSLSISNGNTVLLPSGITYSAGAGISITGSVISNTAPNQTVTITGTGVGGTYPNYTLLAPLTPTFIATGLATINNSAPNYTVDVPVPVVVYNNATGTYSYTQGAFSNSINLSPYIAFNSGTLTVSSSTTVIPGTGLWDRTASSLYSANPGDNVGIGTTNPATKLEVTGDIRIPATNAYTYATAKTKRYSMSALSFNPEGTYHRANLAGGIYIQDGSSGVQGNLYAGVNLPDGAVITTLDAYVLDNDGTGGRDFSYVQLWRQDGAVGSSFGNALNMAQTGGTTGNSSVLQKITTSTITSATIDNTNYTYYIRVGSFQNTSNLILYKVVITYTVLNVD